MAQVLFANFFAWSHAKSLETATQPHTTQRVFNLKLVDFGAGLPAARIGSVMPTDGHFIGIIVYVGENTGATTTSTYKVVRIPKIGGGYDYADEKVLGFVDIPPLETGCFYSDPDTSDGVREYFQYDNIQFRTVKDAGGSEGTKDVHLLLGMATDANSLSGPYTANFNIPPP